ncbi:MAG: hypothetical protein AAGF97_09005, partial [Planctomycetota bacterium]
AGYLPSVQDLARSVHFRGPLEATKYAHARYFCMFLKEQGWLETYYRTFRDAPADDPTGIRTLVRVTGKSIPALDRAFAAWAQPLISTSTPR